MLLKKPYLIFDNTKSVLKLKKKLKKKIEINTIKESDFFMVFGGDGFMLNTIKKFYKFKKPFYGVNCGSYGFLMNKFDVNNLKKKSYNFNVVNINPLQITSKDKNNKKKFFYAINEVSLFRQSKQVAKLDIKIGKKYLIKNLIGDGVLVSTPAGSTAYNFSANGPVLSLNSEKLALTPINPFRPRNIQSKVISNNSVIKIRNLDQKKRPIAAVADNIEFRNISKLIVKLNKKIIISLLFDKYKSLVKKNNLEMRKRLLTIKK